MNADQLARLRVTCAVCGRDKHPGYTCEGKPYSAEARKARVLAWGVAQKAEHDKADQARREGRQYTAKRIEYTYQEGEHDHAELKDRMDGSHI
jgi:hypothetical protein